MSKQNESVEQRSSGEILFDIGRLLLALALLISWFFYQKEPLPLTSAFWGVVIFLAHFFEINLPYLGLPFIYPLLIASLFSFNLTTATVLVIFALVKRSDLEERRDWRVVTMRISEYIILLQAAGLSRLLIGSLELSGWLAPLAGWVIPIVVFFLIERVFYAVGEAVAARKLDLSSFFSSLVSYILGGGLAAFFLAQFYLKGGVAAFLAILAGLFILRGFYFERKEKEKGWFETLLSLINGLEKGILYQNDQTRKILEESANLAEKLQLTAKEKEVLRQVALLHNLSMLPLAALVNRQERLGLDEFEKVKEHPKKLVEALKEANLFPDAWGGLLAHHERYDGTGYPEGKVGEAIPISARILSVVQSYIAMVSPRPYRKAWEEKEALEEIRLLAGTQFDPQIAQAFVVMKGGSFEEAS
jgi:hypothetical protein